MSGTCMVLTAAADVDHDHKAADSDEFDDGEKACEKDPEYEVESIVDHKGTGKERNCTWSPGLATTTRRGWEPAKNLSAARSLRALPRAPLGLSAEADHGCTVLGVFKVACSFCHPYCQTLAVFGFAYHTFVMLHLGNITAVLAAIFSAVP